MKKYFILFAACLFVSLTHAQDYPGSIDFKNGDVASALKIYSKLSNLELAIDPAVTNVSRQINLQVKSASKKEAAKLIEAALRAQDNIVITPLDDKHASVTLAKK